MAETIKTDTSSPTFSYKIYSFTFSPFVFGESSCSDALLN